MSVQKRISKGGTINYKYNQVTSALIYPGMIYQYYLTELLSTPGMVMTPVIHGQGYPIKSLQIARPVQLVYQHVKLTYQLIQIDKL